MTKCPECGTENPNKAEFCKKCGNKLGVSNPSSEGIPGGNGLPQEKSSENKSWSDVKKIGVGIVGTVILLGIIMGGIKVYLEEEKKPGMIDEKIKLVNENLYGESIHKHFAGEIKNTGDKPIRIEKMGFEGVWYYFYEGGQKVGSQVGPTGLEVLEPGQKAPFQVDCPFKEREYDKYKLKKVDWTTIDDKPEKDLYKDLEITNDEGEWDTDTYGNKYYEVTGKIKNTGNVEILYSYISLACTLYNSKGNVIATGSNEAAWNNTSIVYPSDLTLNPGEEADFTITWGGIDKKTRERLLGNIESYSVQVQAVLNL